MPPKVEHSAETPAALRPGKTVRVRHGLDVVPATVVDSYESSNGFRVVVQIEGDDSTMSVPSSDVFTDDVPSVKPPGWWIHSVPYERAVHDVLLDAFRGLGEEAKVRSVAALEKQSDYLLRSDAATVVLEVKFIERGRFGLEQARSVARQLSKIPASTHLLITNAELTSQATELLYHHGIHVVIWRPGDPLNGLISVLDRVLARHEPSSS